MAYMHLEFYVSWSFNLFGYGNPRNPRKLEPSEIRRLQYLYYGHENIDMIDLGLNSDKHEMYNNYHYVVSLYYNIHALLYTDMQAEGASSENHKWF